MDKVYFFILNIFLNSLLAFFTAAILIEGLIFLFRIQQGRVAAFLRMIPILKLPLDLCLYDFSRWSYAHGVNPLHCEEGTRTLSAFFYWMDSVLFLPTFSSIELTVPGNMTFTVADIIGYSIKPMFLKNLSLLCLFLTTFFFIRRLVLYYRAVTALDSLTKISLPVSKKLRNPSLISKIKKYRFQILTSRSLVESPFVAGLISSVVYVPSNLSQNLSRREYEAVLAHEIEHIRYKDSLVRLVLDFIESIFWWVPTKWLRNRIEEGQEVGCDLKCKKYGIDPTDLASAICKCAKYSIKSPNQIHAIHLTKHAIHKRLKVLLQPDSIRFRKIRLAFSFISVGIAFLVIFLGRFWIF